MEIIRKTVQRVNSIIHPGMLFTYYGVERFSFIGGWENMYNKHRTLIFDTKAERDEWVRIYAAVTGAIVIEKQKRI